MALPNDSSSPARFYNLSPEHLDLKDIRQFHLHLLNAVHLSPEAVNHSVSALKVADIDSQRMLLRVEKGKGRKDRYAMLSERLLKVLRIWWRAARPKGSLFPGWRTGKHMSSESLQTACREAARRADIAKRGTVHTLRRTSPAQTDKQRP